MSKKLRIKREMQIRQKHTLKLDAKTHTHAHTYVHAFKHLNMRIKN